MKNTNEPDEEFLTTDQWLSIFCGLKIGLLQSREGLHRKLVKEDDEAWQAVIFGYAFAFVRNIHPLWVLARENQDYDAVFKWMENGIVQRVPVQLKMLPAMNPKETIDGLLEKAKKYSGNDLFLVLFMNRSEFFTTITVPRLQIRQLWLWGWSKPDHSEIYLARVDLEKPETFRVPFRPTPRS
ncbi:MAG: hypothetical protein HY736_09650 [Verrucomicrobia bacterium]|nr:hypothetical protein [Verrucomicrobiota bacterium]